MKIGAYQFAVTNNIKHNVEIIRKAITQAAQEGVDLLVFPECALTGYPPRDIESSSLVNFDELNLAYEQLQKLAIDHVIHIVVGTIMQEK